MARYSYSGNKKHKKKQNHASEYLPYLINELADEIEVVEQVLSGGEEGQILTADSAGKAKWSTPIEIEIEPAPSYNVVKFDGTQGQITAGTDSSLDNIFASSPATVDAWIKYSPVGSTKARDIIYKNVDWAGWIFCVYEIYESAGKWFRLLAWMAGDSDVIQSYCDFLPFADEWAHVLIVYDPTSLDKEFHMAINGIWQETFMVSSGVGQTPPSDSGVLVTLGGDAPRGNFVKGSLGWVRISSGIRYPIGTNFIPPARHYIPLVDSATKELWPMADGQGTIVNSMVNFGNKGTLSGGIWDTEAFE